MTENESDMILYFGRTHKVHLKYQLQKTYLHSIYIQINTTRFTIIFVLLCSYDTHIDIRCIYMV
jgi:hypothetical protein